MPFARGARGTWIVANLFMKMTRALRKHPLAAALAVAGGAGVLVGVRLGTRSSRAFAFAEIVTRLAREAALLAVLAVEVAEDERRLAYE